ncbi:MAG: cytochrome c [Bacteroidota bacterium]
MKKILTLIMICGAFTVLILSNGCVESKAVAAKTGTQLWAENCQRCHNTPSPTTFSDEQWKTVGMHMQTRALLTNKERDKIVDFMQSFNHMSNNE